MSNIVQSCEKSVEAGKAAYPKHLARSLLPRSKFIEILLDFVYTMLARTLRLRMLTIGVVSSSDGKCQVTSERKSEKSERKSSGNPLEIFWKSSDRKCQVSSERKSASANVHLGYLATIRELNSIPPSSTSSSHRSEFPVLAFILYFFVH